MKVTVDKIGGFVGFSRFQVNSNDLNQEDQRRLFGLVEKAKASGKQQTHLEIPSNEPFVQVVVESQEGADVIAAPEIGESNDLGELIQFLETHGRPKALD